MRTATLALGRRFPDGTGGSPLDLFRPVIHLFYVFSCCILLYFVLLCFILCAFCLGELRAIPYHELISAPSLVTLYVSFSPPPSMLSVGACRMGRYTELSEQD